MWTIHIFLITHKKMSECMYLCGCLKRPISLHDICLEKFIAFFFILRHITEGHIFQIRVSGQTNMTLDVFV